MNFLTDRKRAQGLGAGHGGTHHHWQMMASSIALVFLVPLFVVTFSCGFGGSWEEVREFFGRPWPVLITALTLVVGIFHLTNEARAAIEDYVHGLAGKLCLIFVDGLSYVLIAISLFALAKMAL